MTTKLDHIEKVLTYDNFSGGEFGALAAQHAPPGSFTAKNMTLYRSGLLGPRAGLKQLAVTGATANPVVGFWWSGTPNKAIVWVIGTAVQSCDDITPGAATTWTGALTTAPTAASPASFTDTASSESHLVVYGDKGYKLTYSTTTVSAVAAIPGGRHVAVFGDRLYVCNKSTNPNRIYYSDAADFTTFGATSFFDVGNSARGAVVGLFPQRDHLAILMQNGEWWMLTSPTIANASLRRVGSWGTQPWSANWRSAVVMGDDNIAFFPANLDIPFKFTGSTLSPLAYMKVSDAMSYQDFLNVNAGNPYADIQGINVLRGAKLDEWFAYYPPTKKAVTYKNGVHTLHTFENVTLTAFGASDIQGHYYITDGGATGVAPLFYSFQTTLDRPAFTSDTKAQPGDASTTPFDAYVYMPEHWQPAGREAMVRQVVVDFVKWNTGSGSTNHFTCAVDVIGKYAVDGVSTTTSQSFDEAGASSSTSGTRARQVFNFGTDAGIGAGFQIKLTAIRGVAIQSIKVIYDDTPARPAR